MARARGKKVVFYAPRRELIYQIADELFAGDQSHGVIMAGEQRHWAGIQVASFDTVRSQMSRGQPPPRGDLCLVDEAHLSISPKRQEIIQHYLDAGSVVVGLTATPARGDGRGLGEIYDDMIVAKPVQWFIDRGHLVPARYYAPDRPDLEKVKIARGDYVVDQLGRVVDDPQLIGNIVTQWHRLGYGRSTVVFCVNRAHSRHVCEEFVRQGVAAEHLDGETPNDERRDILNRVRSGATTVLCNVFVCLDDRTEILTRDGWKSRTEITLSDEVANWENGRIWFSRPLKLMQREVAPGEKMVKLRTRNRSFRVTEGHKMLWSDFGYKEVKKLPAREIVGRSGHLPVSGIAAHETEAKRRVRVKDDAVVMIKAHDLSPGQCWLIGFWIGDGSKAVIKDGSVRYTFAQSERNAHILQMLTETLREERYDHRIVKKTHPTGKGGGVQHVVYVGRGTGGGSQKRRGFFGIDRHLDKNLPDTAWCLDRDQLEEFLDGLWWADGNHSRKEPNGKAIWTANQRFADRLQALLVCRGFKSNVRSYKNGDGLIFRVSYVRRETHACTKYRPEYDDAVPGEKVWCVETESGNIVTRRDGYVTVMGNCTYGLDIPSLECAVLARPTKSVSLYHQTLGRVMRPSPGKDHALVIDHAGAVAEHGLFSDPVPWSLDAKEKVQERKEAGQRERKDPKDITCPNCSNVFRAARVCPKCGHAALRPSEDIPYYEADLKEVEGATTADKRNANTSWDEKVEFMGGLKAYARRKGYKPGWVAHAYRKRFGVWPNDPRVKNATPREPNGSVKGHLKYLQIQNAKRKGAGRG